METHPALEHEDLELDVRNLNHFVSGNIEEEEEEEDVDDFDDDNDDALLMDIDRDSRTSTFSESTDHQNLNELKGLDDKSLEACLANNQMYQDHLRDIMSQLELALSSNRDKRAELEEQSREYQKQDINKGHLNTCKKWTVTKAPYFRSLDGFQCCPSSDDPICQNEPDNYSYYLHPLKWKKQDKLALSKAVKINIRKYLMGPAMNRRDLLKDKLQRDDLSEQDRSNIKKNIAQLEVELDKLRDLPDSQLFDADVRELDWLEISINQFEGKRSPESCELMWKNSLHPTVNKTRWSQDEDKSLREFAEGLRCRDWNLIAQKLNDKHTTISGSKRTPLQCIQRYQSYLDPSNQNGPWTNVENKLLMKSVDENTFGNRIAWNKVASNFSGRSLHLVRQHWINTLSDSSRKGQFCIEEDLVIMIGVKKYGLDFRRVTRLLPGRNYSQCRDRYYNSLRADINGQPWTIEEDKKLTLLARDIGYKWSNMVKDFVGRTHNSLMQRFQRIIKHIPDALERVDDPSFNWPVIVSNKNNRFMRRKQMLRDFVHSRLEQLRITKMKGRNRARTTFRTIKPSKPLNPVLQIPVAFPEESQFTDLPEMTLEEIDFVVKEAQLILSKKKNKDSLESFLGRKPKSQSDLELDKALDEILSPSVHHTSRSFSHINSFMGKAGIEFEHCKSALFKALKVIKSNDLVESIQTVDDQSENNIEMADSEEREELDEKSLKEQEKEARFELKEQMILDTIDESCLDNENVNHPSNIWTCSLLPPMRSTIQALKLLMLDRERLAVSAQEVEDLHSMSMLSGYRDNQIILCDSCKEKGIKKMGEAAKQKNKNGPSLDTPSCYEPRPATSATYDNDTGLGLRSLNVQGNPNSYIVKRFEPYATSSGQVDSTEESTCKECQILRSNCEKFRLLDSRFLSLFFWPGLMAMVKPPEKELENHGMISQNFKSKKTISRERYASRKAIENLDKDIPKVPIKRGRKPKADLEKSNVITGQNNLETTSQETGISNGQLHKNGLNGTATTYPSSAKKLKLSKKLKDASELKKNICVRRSSRNSN